jgi:hypothetical protein
MATFFDPSTIAGWFDDGQLLRAYLGDRSRHADLGLRSLAFQGGLGVIAGTTRTQAGATQLTPGYNAVQTSTSTASQLGDGVALPAASGGQICLVDNRTANPIQVYGSNGGSDTVNTVVGSTGIMVPQGTAAIFVPIPGTGWVGIGGSNPPNEVTQFGLGQAFMQEEGNINRQISATGITSNTTAAQDTVLAAYTLPANCLDIVGRGITITAQGSFAANANATKQCSIFFNCTTATVGSAVTGGTKIADTGAVATNGQGWSLQAEVFKGGSNTQLALHQQAQVGNAVSALLSPITNINATDTAPILIAVTSRNTTAGTDVVFNFMEVNAMN